MDTAKPRRKGTAFLILAGILAALAVFGTLWNQHQAERRGAGLALTQQLLDQYGRIPGLTAAELAVKVCGTRVGGWDDAVLMTHIVAGLPQTERPAAEQITRVVVDEICDVNG